jgi:hypothetical protein
MAFRSRRKQYTPRPAERGQDPASIEFYPSKNPNTVQRWGKAKAYSAGYKAIALPYRYGFQLRANGKPFLYQGITTKAYTAKTICNLFAIDRVTLFRWVSIGVMPEPMIKVVGSQRNERTIWFYHQVQPVYAWYTHQRSLGVKRVMVDKVLIANLRRSQVRFEKLLGIEQVDEYFVMAGKYGVVPLDR